MRNLRLVALCMVAAIAAVSCSGPGGSTAERSEGGSGSARDMPSEKPSDGADRGDRSAGNDRKEARWDGPDFTVETFDGDEFHLAAQAGTPVVLNFWESW